MRRLSAWFGLAFLTLVATVVGLAFQNLAMQRLDASQVATFGNVAPLLTVLWGYLLFDERISAMAVVGGSLVMLGIAWASRPARKPRPVASIPEPVPAS